MKNMKTDFAIIGGGACGLSAALTASEKGVHSIIFDKNEELGGMTNYAEGMFGVGTKLQKELKLTYTPEDRFQEHMFDTKWMANARLVRRFMDMTADTFDWLESQGCEFTGVVSGYRGAPFVWHMIKASERGKHGSEAPGKYGLMRPLLARANENEYIQILNPVRVTDILRGEDGKIQGVIAVDQNGEEIHVEAKCVLCATGGYADDRELMEKYVRGGQYMTSMIPAGQTGDSQKMAWKLGAAMEGMGVTQTFTMLPGEGFTTVLQQVAQQPNLWVNKNGERYIDESTVRAFSWSISALAKQPEATAHCIIDTNLIHFLETEEPMFSIGEYLVPGESFKNVEEELQRGVREGKIMEADSIEELAAKIGCDAAVLQHTIDEYNECCDKNYDFLFAKDKRYLCRIEGPKYYASTIKGFVGITEGGIRINHNTEVMDNDFHVIPGLYAGGCAAGGFIGDTYCEKTSGGSLSFALNSGRMCGWSVCDYLGK